MTDDLPATINSQLAAKGRSRGAEPAAAAVTKEGEVLSLRRKGALAYLGLGSNLDDPQRQIESAITAIGRLPRTTVLRRSPMYVSQPWGKLDQPDFLNLVLEVRTTLTPQALLRHCKRIEAEQGRQEGERWGPRQVDIDILMFGDLAVNTPALVVPHPRMWERAFVLRPLADLRPDLRTPEGTPVSEVLRRDDIAAQGIWPYEKINLRHES